MPSKFTTPAFHSSQDLYTLKLQGNVASSECALKEAIHSWITYLIDEAQSCCKGASSIVFSMVHHYLQNFTFGEDDIQLHADNCVGQNKSNTMTSYLAWRVMVGLSKSCELSFMLPGHTKFSPDRLIKRKYRRTKVSSLAEIAKFVEGSTIGGQNKAYVIGSEHPSMPFQ